MNKSDLVSIIAEKLDIPYIQSQRVIQLFLDEILRVLSEDESVTLSGFGRFYIKKIPPRTRRNPKTGEEIDVPERPSVNFKLSRKEKKKIIEIFEQMLCSEP